MLVEVEVTFRNSAQMGIHSCGELSLFITEQFQIKETNFRRLVTGIQSKIRVQHTTQHSPIN